MKIKVELDTAALKKLVVAELKRTLGDVEFSDLDIKILVKSREDRRTEWEVAEFKAVLEKDT